MEKLNLKEFVAVVRALISTKDEVISVSEVENVKSGDVWYGLKIQTNSGGNEPIYLNGYYREYLEDKINVRYVINSMMELINECSKNPRPKSGNGDEAGAINNMEQPERRERQFGEKFVPLEEESLCKQADDIRRQEISKALVEDTPNSSEASAEEPASVKPVYDTADDFLKKNGTKIISKEKKYKKKETLDIFDEFNLDDEKEDCDTQPSESGEAAINEGRKTTTDECRPRVKNKLDSCMDMFTSANGVSENVVSETCAESDEVWEAVTSGGVSSAASVKTDMKDDVSVSVKNTVLKNVTVHIVNKNNPVCKNSANIEIGDMCMTFNVFPDNKTVTKELCEKFDISIEELRSAALKNSAEKMPLKVCKEGKTEAGVPYCLLSNTEELYGASVVLYPGVLKKFAEIFDDDLHIVPLTTDFMMLMPAGKVDSLSLSVSLRMVTDVVKEKTPEIFVSDMLYRYMKDEDSIICEDLVYVP